MGKFEGPAKNNFPEKSDGLEAIKNRVISQAALRLAKNEVVGNIVTGKEQYITEYFQNQIKHKRMLIEKDGQIKEEAENLTQELEKLYSDIADLHPSVDDLIAYYNKRKEREAK